MYTSVRTGNLQGYLLEGFRDFFALKPWRNIDIKVEKTREKDFQKVQFSGVLRNFIDVPHETRNKMTL